jgi:two-component system cell cycle sensor histidine kinase/response regulator CckA
MPEPLNVLIVEDCRDDAELLVRELSRAGFAVKWQLVETEVDYLSQLETRPDIVLSDYSMPQFDGLRAMDLLQELGLNIPFILISGTVGEEIAVEAVKHGAADYLLKDRIARLGTAVRRALHEAGESGRRRKLEAQFIEAQKMEVIGQLASGVAHDFNNILMTIMGYNDMISQEIDPAGPLQGYTSEIRHAAQRAAGLTRQLLVFSRKEKVLPVVLNLNEVVRDHEQMLRRLAGETIELTVLPGKQSSLIKADAGYVGQVLMNLAVNARDAMPGGGSISIIVRNITLGEDGAGVPAGSYVMLGVSDTGVGMPESVKARIFEAFFTTKPRGKGTGLGLATCRTIVQQSGGHIEVESTPGKGTTFKIYFPAVHQTAAVAGSRPAGEETVSGGSETLLVVEDESTVRNLACGVLASRGYDVLAASNGREALQVVSSHQGNPISLVVTDVIMPEMGGKVMAEWLKATHPDIKILFTSGYTDDALAPQGVLEEGVQFFSKPYSPAALIRKVREILDQGIA